MYGEGRGIYLLLGSDDNTTVSRIVQQVIEEVSAVYGLRRGRTGDV